MMYFFLYYFSYTVYFGVVIYLNIPFIYKYVYPLSCVQRLFFRMKLVKCFLRTQLKQTNLKNRLHISRESPKKCFNDTVI